MNDLELRNLEYTAIRFSGTITGNTVKELISKGIISSHLDITGEGFERLYKDRDKMELTSGARGKIAEMYEARSRIDELLKSYIETADENDISVISCEDEDYPFVWKNLTGMPRVFFIRGNRNLLRECYMRGSAGVVGSRRPGKYALYATEDFVKEFSKEGIVTVSGMALGIDRKAHEAALDNYGKTIAVMAGGPDNIYPPENEDIYERLCDKGLILSEMPPGQQAVKQYFPSRNRLISALSDVCLVMQAGQFSGTLHTASFAASQGKDVFVLPNNIYSADCLGGLYLLRDGAEVLIDPFTVIERIRNETMNRKILAGDDIDDESSWKRMICDELSARPMTADDLSAMIPIPFSLLTSLLTDLELDRKIEEDRGKYVLTIGGH